MCSDQIVVRAERICKTYHIYDQPRDRLKQFIYPRLQRLVGREGTQYYREFKALEEVSFEVKRGEAFGIIGRNGSGKSTLLQILTGTLSPTTGSCGTKGRVAALLELGSGFNPEFSGRENVYLNGSILGLSRHEIDEKFESIAAFADIGPYIEQPVKTYSSGMMVRLAFAVQVQLEPDILIVDEALAVGDALFQKRCFQKIEEMTSKGVTLLFVSHDEESVRTLTHRALLLRDGRPVICGMSSEVLLEYRRQLHADESRYLSNAADSITERVTVAQPSVLLENENSSATPSRTDKLSFGEGETLVEKVEVFNAHGEDTKIFYPGDQVKIRIHCQCVQKINHLNVGLRIRNKEGVKIYSWGTLNQDMAVRAGLLDAPMFWSRTFFPGEIFFVDFDFNCDLGINLYEIQAAVSQEGRLDYTAQRILHWRDEAAFFHVNMIRDEYFFGGVADLRMAAVWNNSEAENQALRSSE